MKHQKRIFTLTFVVCILSAMNFIDAKKADDPIGMCLWGATSVMFLLLSFVEFKKIGE